MDRAGPNVVYALERFHWRRARGAWLRLPGADRILTFADRDIAEAQAREREWGIRRRVNPFVCGPFLHYQTSFDAARLFDWCLDAGLDPPVLTNDSRIWADWWSLHQPKMTDIQRATMWEALDRVRFFRVSESPRGLSCHLVATRHYDFDVIGPLRHESYRYVGCTPYMLVREPSAADELCHQLFIDNLAASGEYVGDVVSPSTWTVAPTDPFAIDEEEPEYWEEAYPERRPLELIAERPLHAGQEVFVVLRRHWILEEGGQGFWRWSLTHAKKCGRPVAAFDTQAAAYGHEARLEAEARQFPGLFRFGPPHEWSDLFDPSAIFGLLIDMAPIRFTSLWEDYRAADREWCRWWDEALPTLTAEQFEFAWSLYDRLRFYDVVAVEYRE